MDRDAQNTFAVRLGQRHAQPVWELRQADGQPVAEAERFLHTLVLRGLFVLQPWVQRNPQDTASPWTLVFDANTWTAIQSRPAPPHNRDRGYTLDVPDPQSVQ